MPAQKRGRFDPMSDAALKAGLAAALSNHGGCPATASRAIMVHQKALPILLARAGGFEAGTKGLLCRVPTSRVHVRPR